MKLSTSQPLMPVLVAKASRAKLIQLYQFYSQLDDMGGRKIVDKTHCAMV